MRFREYINSMRLSESDNGRSGATFTDPHAGGEAATLLASQQADGSYSVNQDAIREGGGYRPVARGRGPGYEHDLADAKRLIESVMRGNKWDAMRLNEALTTSDFPLLFGDVLDRSVLANYAETPYSWDLYAKRNIINDLRLARMFRVDRGSAVLDGPIIPNSYGATGAGTTGIEQVSEYPLRKRVVSGYTDQLYKFGCRMDFSLETMLNDDLEALKDTAALFGRAARRTEEERATKLFATSSGPNTSFFNNANHNLVNGTSIPGCPYTNPPFSIDALMWALTGLANQRDLDGMPISIEAAVIVFGPSIKVPVMNALNATELWLNMEGGNIATYGATVNPAANFTAATSGIRMKAANWAKDFARPALNYFLPVVDTTYGATSWYVFAAPSTGRPAMQLSFLRGRERPEMFMRASNQIAIGEGRMGPGAGSMVGSSQTNPMEGDYETDAIDYKCRYFLGGTLLDPVLGMASNGSGV